MTACMPSYQSERAVTAWRRQLVEQFESKRSLVLRAIPVAELADVAAARTEVDRVLDSTVASFPKGRVTTLAESRTAVLLGEILDVVGAHVELHDPRLDALFGYDRKHSVNLCESVETVTVASSSSIRTG
jgi:hypothetical protein